MRKPKLRTLVQFFAAHLADLLNMDEGNDETVKKYHDPGAVVMCADCRYWDGHEDSMGVCTLLPDERYVQVPIDDHISLKLITADDFGCCLGETHLTDSILDCAIARFFIGYNWNNSWRGSNTEELGSSYQNCKRVR